MSAPFLPSCDRSMAGSSSVQETECSGTSHPRLVLATTVLASSLAFIDGSIVNVGLPSIGRDFEGAAPNLSWVISAYLLPLSALLLLGGAAGDRFGRRLLMLLGVGLFAAASLLCAMAPNLTWLLLGRVLQGTGAAMLMPTSLAILGASFGGEARGKAVGTWAAAGAAAGAIGPLVGGWLIDVLGWRSMFLVNLPIAFAAFYLTARYVPDQPHDRAPLDLAGAVLATAGLAAVTWGLTAASAGGGISWTAALSASIGVALLLLFLVVEHMLAEGAMLPLKLFSSPLFTGLSLTTFLLYGSLGSLLVLLPYVFIELGRYSATAAGAALLPMPVVIALSARTMGRMAANIGPRVPLTLGPAVVAVGFVLAARIASGGSYWTHALPALLVISVGTAGAVAPLTTAVLASVDPQHSGIAAGLNSALARTGGLVASALSSAILVAHGESLQATFRVAMYLAGLAAAGASLCAFFWLKENSAKSV